MARRSGRGWFEADDLRRALPFFSLVFAAVAVITQPSSAPEVALTAVPVVAWSLWAFARVPLAAVALAIVVPVVLAQRSGELEPIMFNATLLAFAAARWSRSLAAAASLGDDHGRPEPLRHERRSVSQRARPDDAAREDAPRPQRQPFLTALDKNADKSCTPLRMKSR